ncbi:hypothetical protein ANO11243_072880 [Dothideomycetidae sp. 11243]|nr:hypothetical protein ANO11243_072880 [fungal sp. No.11243]
MAKLSYLLVHLLSVSILALPSDAVFATRRTLCGGESSLRACGAGFPTSFCCPTNARCLPANSTGIVAVICCPDGQDCDFVEPINCNITLQNALLFPTSAVHTLNLTENLPQCGSQCCPLSYGCVNDTCVAHNGKAVIPSYPSSMSSVLASPTSSSTKTSHSSTSTTISTGTSSTAESSTQFNGRSFATGFLHGIIIGAAVLFALLFYLASRRISGSRASKQDLYESNRDANPPASTAAKSDQQSSNGADLVKGTYYPPLPTPPAPPDTARKTAELHSPDARTKNTFSQHVQHGESPLLPPLPPFSFKSTEDVPIPRPLRVRPRNRNTLESTATDKDDRASSGTIRVVMSPDQPSSSRDDGFLAEDYRLPVPPPPVPPKNPNRQSVEGGYAPSRVPRSREEGGVVDPLSQRGVRWR